MIQFVQLIKFIL